MWKVGSVQQVNDASLDGLAWGFNITNEKGRPLVTFTYETRGAAESAATHAQAVVDKALLVRPQL
jgi:hypothetical protein